MLSRFQTLLSITTCAATPWPASHTPTTPSPCWAGGTTAFPFRINLKRHICEAVCSLNVVAP
jgi:hypothetical protein